jgi:hypothetical protein
MFATALSTYVVVAVLGRAKSRLANEVLFTEKSGESENTA